MLLVLLEGLSRAPLRYFWPRCLRRNSTFITENKACSWIVNKMSVFPSVLSAPFAGTMTGVRRCCLPQLLPATTEQVRFLTAHSCSFELLGSQQTCPCKPHFVRNFFVFVAHNFSVPLPSLCMWRGQGMIKVIAEILGVFCRLPNQEHWVYEAL